MTFSVEVDFWPFQAGSPQEAISRQGAGEGRGKDFASSLLGNEQSPAQDSNFTPGQGGALTLASLSFLAPSPVPATELASGDLVEASEASIAPAEVLFETNPETGADAELASGDGAKASETSVALGEVLLETSTGAGADVQTLSAEGVPEAPADDLIANAEPPRGTPDAAQGAPLSSDIPTPDMTKPLLSEGEIEVAAEAKGEETAAEMTGEAPVALPLMAAPPQTTPQTLANQPISNTALAISDVQTAGPAPMPLTPPVQDQPAASPRRTTAAASADAAPLTGLLMEPASDVAEFAAPIIGEMTFDTTTAQTGGDTSSGQTQVQGLVHSVTGQTGTAAQPGSNPLAAQFTPTNAMLIATASQLPDIVGRATSDAAEDRVVVQLDPPELGRVSIDFKFDAQGLQHVTITAESPEAMRQLRQMHFELVQALERNGLSGQNMSFQHQNPQQNEGWAQQARLTAARFDAPALTGNGLILAADTNSPRQIGANGRLDIRL